MSRRLTGAVGLTIEELESIAELLDTDVETLTSESFLTSGAPVANPIAPAPAGAPDASNGERG